MLVVVRSVALLSEILRLFILFFLQCLIFFILLLVEGCSGNFCQEIYSDVPIDGKCNHRCMYMMFARSKFIPIRIYNWVHDITINKFWYKSIHRFSARAFRYVHVSVRTYVVAYVFVCKCGRQKFLFSSCLRVSVGKWREHSRIYCICKLCQPAVFVDEPKAPFSVGSPWCRRRCESFP